MKSYASIDAYLKQFDAGTRAQLQTLRESIHKAAPSAEEAISYGIPTFKLNGNLVHFGCYKNHIGFYPGASGIASFQKELSAYEMSKGTVRFPLGKPLPLALITRIVKFRIKKNKERLALKQKK